MAGRDVRVVSSDIAVHAEVTKLHRNWARLQQVGLCCSLMFKVHVRLNHHDEKMPACTGPMATTHKELSTPHICCSVI